MKPLKNLKIDSTDIDQSRIQYSELNKMKESFPLHKDEDLLRFLISQQYDFTSSYLMFRSHLEWLQQTNKPNKISILKCLLKKWIYLNGYDREGHPLLIVRMNRHRRDELELNDLIMEQLWWFDHV